MENTFLEDKHNIFFLYGDIDRESGERLTRFLMERELSKKTDLVKLFINSDGGMVTDGLGIIDMMNSVSYPIWTYTFGQCCSIALLIFMNGEKGHRYIFNNTVIMSHQWEGMPFAGKQHEMEALIKQNQMITDQIESQYIQHTKLNIDEIRQKLLPPSDVFLIPEEAIKFGMGDHIFKTFK